MLEVLVDNKNGNIWDISGIVSDLSWNTARIGKAGKLDMTIIDRGIYQDKAFTLKNGDIVAVRKGKTYVFYGYIFSIVRKQDEAVSVTCYDQIRYLLNQDKILLANVTASDVLKKIANKYNLRLGHVEDTSIRIPTFLQEGTLLDMICTALTRTLMGGGKNYFLLDENGALSLRASEDHLLDFIIGDQSLMTGYSSKNSIDSDTYNQIVFYRDDRNTGKRMEYLKEDITTIDQWGLLKLYESVDEKLSDAEIKNMLDTYLFIKNREQKSLKVEAIGDIRVRAGYYARILIEHLGINQPYIVNECTHKISDNQHTMSLDLRVI